MAALTPRDHGGEVGFTRAATREELTARCGHECLRGPDHDGTHFYGYIGGPYSYEGLLAGNDHLRATIERYLESVTSNAPEDERTAAWDDLVLTVW